MTGTLNWWRKSRVQKRKRATITPHDPKIALGLEPSHLAPEAKYLLSVVIHLFRLPGKRRQRVGSISSRSTRGLRHRHIAGREIGDYVLPFRGI